MAGFRTYRISLTGSMPLILHGDNLEWRQILDTWRKHPDNRAKTVKGDDRSPAWSWVGGVYHDGVVLGIPSDNLMTCIREGGSRVGVASGTRGLTFKRQSQSGLVVNELLWPIVGPNGTVAWPDVNALVGVEDFPTHQQFARDRGFDLFCKSARVAQSKHVRVRAKFLQWAAQGTLTVLDDTITTGVLTSILEASGRYAGLGDWRPSSPKSPGPYGTFSVRIEEA